MQRKRVFTAVYLSSLSNLKLKRKKKRGKSPDSVIDAE